MPITSQLSKVGIAMGLRGKSIIRSAQFLVESKKIILLKPMDKFRSDPLSKKFIFAANVDHYRKTGQTI